LLLTRDDTPDTVLSVDDRVTDGELHRLTLAAEVTGIRRIALSDVIAKAPPARHPLQELGTLASNGRICRVGKR
jgi:hypothetical protein